MLDGDAGTSVLATVDASAATGAVDMSGVALTVGGSITGGSGADTATITAASTGTHAFGSGNDTVTVSTLGTDGTVAGGAGTDTLVMAAEDADTADASAAFNSAVTGFEKLSLDAVLAATGNMSVDVSVLTYDHVITAGTDGTDVLTLSGVGASATTEITGAGAFAITLDDATGSS